MRASIPTSGRVAYSVNVLRIGVGGTIVLRTGMMFCVTSERSRVKAIPAWLFHGAADPTVPVTESRQLNAALEKAGAVPRYTEYEGVGHNSWDRAFNDPDLAKWLLAQRRTNR